MCSHIVDTHTHPHVKRAPTIPCAMHVLTSIAIRVVRLAKQMFLLSTLSLSLLPDKGTYVYTQAREAVEKNQEMAQAQVA